MNQSIILFIFITAFLFSCSKDTTMIVLSDSPLTLSTEPTILVLKQPLQRFNRSLSIRIQLNEKWEPEPPWINIRLHDGTIVTIKAALISDSGKQYYPNVIGAADGLDIRFNDPVPKDIKIVKIILTSTHPLTALNIKWVDWNPN